VGNRTGQCAFLVGTGAVLWGCAGGPAPIGPGPDPHSYSRPDQVSVRHLDLDLDVDFDARRLVGSATLHLERTDLEAPLRLDARRLDILSVTLEPGGRHADFRLGPEREWIGSPLVVELDPDTDSVRIDYATGPAAAALQWIEPGQTSGTRPFLLTQSQAILARSWIPLQDTPSVRMTYDATIRVPPGLLALMSAENPTEAAADGTHRFTMPQPVPSYLLALAVGDLEFRRLSDRTGVYALPSVIDRAAWEFADTPRMMDAAEELYGPYRWGRFDVLVLPPSFPYGGMENPRLTFVTPTLLAGDRSLVSTIAHELAHSWSGNLVTSADWNDFWLNEGFTVYFELRIMESLYGRDYSEMLASLGRQDLATEFEELRDRPQDTRLRVDLAGRNPEDGMTMVAYEKGYLLLRLLEETFGRTRWDAFLRDYFDRFAFEPMTSERFLDHLGRQMLAGPEGERLARGLRLDRWVHEPGLPDNAPTPASDAFDRVDGQLAAWRAGRSAGDLDTAGWTTQQWLHFVRNLPADARAEDLRALDQAFGFTATGNAEILQAWLLEAIRTGYEPATPALERFLTDVGRLKFLRPLYVELQRTPAGAGFAREIYRKARGRYHTLATDSLDPLFESAAAEP